MGIYDLFVFSVVNGISCKNQASEISDMKA